MTALRFFAAELLAIACLLAFVAGLGAVAFGVVGH